MVEWWGSQNSFKLYAHRVAAGAMRTTIKPTMVPIIWQGCDSLEEECFSRDTMGHWLNPTRGNQVFVGVVRPNLLWPQRMTSRSVDSWWGP